MSLLIPSGSILSGNPNTITDRSRSSSCLDSAKACLKMIVRMGQAVDNAAEMLTSE